MAVSRSDRRSGAPGDRLLLVAFFVSGAAALGYEILWTRLLGVALGSESLGVLGTLGGFFGGLALGSWFFHGRVLASRDPLRLFALFEVVAALYALASPWLLYLLAAWLPPRIGPIAGNNDHPSALLLALAVAGLALLPATAPMGATLAALVEARRRVLPEAVEGRGLGRLYGANTFGATAGVLVSVHLLLPRVGLAWGAFALALTGLAAAGLALVWGRRRAAPADPPAQAAERGKRAKAAGKAAAANDAPADPRQIYLLLLAAGLAGVGLEVVGVQVLAQLFEDTVYTFADILAVFLLGTAAGAWIYGRAAPRLLRRPAGALTAALLLALGLSVALAGAVLSASPALLERIAPDNAGHTARLTSELALAALVFTVPTLLMGALGSHLLAQLAPRGVGRGYGLNTLGATLSPFLFGLAAIPLAGYAGALYLALGVYAALYAAVRLGTQRPRRIAGTLSGLALLAVAGWLAPKDMALVETPAGWTELASRETLMGLVRVTEEESSRLPGRLLNRRLEVNRHFRMGGGAAFGERRMGHLPLLLAPGARRVLFLGVATGSTLGAVRHHPVERVEAVELVPEILELLPLFEHTNEGVAADPRVRLHAADARRWVAASGARFDLVVADLFHPARDGAGSLFSCEHFVTVREHLAPGAPFVQWLPLYQFDPENLKTVIRTFLAVFPEVHSWLGIYNAYTPALALVGQVPAPGAERLTVDLETLRRRLAAPIFAELLMQDPRDLLASYMLDREALAAYAGEGPLNTDLDPRVLFDAPRSAYENAPDINYRSLSTLLPHRRLYPESLLRGEAADLGELRRQVAAFSAALGHYLEGDILRAAAGPRAAVPPAAVERYLEAYAAAPEFAPAGQVLFAVAGSDPAAAGRVLATMLERTPDDPRLRLAYREHRLRNGM